MPDVNVNDVTFYCNTRGVGHPLVLIRGLGSNADHWYPQIPPFSSFFRVISFDNRGIGRSNKPDGPCTIAMMAEDTAGIMDAMGIQKAHIMGLSMGGMIAQEFALRFPHRVHGLVLACTHCGGGKEVPPLPRNPKALFRIYRHRKPGSGQGSREMPLCGAYPFQGSGGGSGIPANLRKISTGGQGPASAMGGGQGA